jgi:predicted phosphoribosyltransferase
MKYRDRSDAGHTLARALAHYAERPDLTVLALPRGGVPVAFEVAAALHAPLDVFLVRKLGVPGHEELAMGAIASGGVRVLNAEVIDKFRIAQDVIDAVAAEELSELERRERVYRAGRPPLAVEGRTIILVDDGLATGSTMRAALGGLELHGPAAIVVAVPVAAEETCQELSGRVLEVVCPYRPSPLHAVGLWYENFAQTSDAEVRALLARAGHGQPATPAPT